MEWKTDYYNLCNQLEQFSKKYPNRCDKMTKCLKGLQECLTGVIMNSCEECEDDEGNVT